MNNPKHLHFMNVANRVALIKVLTHMLFLAGSIQVLLSAELDEQKNRFDVSYRPGFNISVSFKNVGTPAFPNNPSFNGRSYQDGFVGTDDTGNALDLTTYWGYASTEEQVVGDSLLMRNSHSGTYASDVEDNPQQGFEFRYARELGKTRRLAWGAEFALGYTDLSIKDNRMAGPGTLAVDAFSLGGITPPTATPADPYIGPYSAGPGAPLLGASPTQLPVTVSSDFQADVIGLRLGPYVEFALSERIAVSVSAGFALLFVDSDFSYRESVTTSGGGVVSRVDSSSNNDWVPGGYIAGQFSVEVVKSVRTFTGLELQTASSYEHRTGDKIANVDFSKSVFLFLGVGCTF